MLVCSILRQNLNDYLYSVPNTVFGLRDCRVSLTQCPILLPVDSYHHTVIYPELMPSSTMDSGQPLSPEMIQQILNMPVTAPPPHHVQNLEDPPNNNKLALGVLAASVVLSTVFSLLRAYSRFFYAGKFRLEDCE